MTERGIVTKLDGRLVTVQLEMQDGCGVCGNEACKTGRRSIQGYNRQDIALAEGDAVELAVSGRAQLSGAFWILGMPLLVFAGGYVLGRLLFPGSSEAPAALAGLAGLALGMSVGVLVQKRQKMDSLPSLTRKLEPEIGLEAKPDWSEGSPDYIHAAAD